MIIKPAEWSRGSYLVLTCGTSTLSGHTVARFRVFLPRQTARVGRSCLPGTYARASEQASSCEDTVSMIPE